MTFRPQRALVVALAAACAGVVGLIPATASAKPGCTHEVAKGDTVSRIAHKHDVSEANLIRANPELKKNPNRLRIGQVLEICRAKRLSRSHPSKCGEGGRIVRHQVDRGDTLISIARKYSVKLPTLRKYNKRLRRSSVIRVGESIKVCTTSRRWTNRSWLTDGVQLPEGDGYTRRPNHAWGTALTIRGILDAIARYRKEHPDAPPVSIGDISRQRGGPLGSHLSHQEGRDVDISYVFEEHEDGRRRIDLRRSWALIESFLEDDPKLAAIFVDYKLQKRLYEYALSTGADAEQLDTWFEYPREEDDAVVYHWPGHTGHFHVRFVDSEPPEDKGSAGERPASEAGDDRPMPALVLGVARHRAVASP